MTTLVVSPQYPIPKMAIRLSLADTDAAANWVRYNITAAPEGSALRKRLDASGKTQVAVFADDLAKPYELTPDVGGRYTFIVEEFTRGVTSNGGGYQFAPESAPTETKLAETTLTLEVGQKLECTLGVNQDTAKLRLYVFGDYVRATTFAVHGEDTPAIVNPTTQKARNVAEDTTIGSNVDALIDETAADITGSVEDVFEDLRDTIDGHFGNATAHNSADTHNPLGIGFGASTNASAGASIDALRRALEAHMANTNASGPGEGDYHDNADHLSKFASSGAGVSRLSQFIALADIARVYEAHRNLYAPSIAIHNSFDSTNVAGELPRLMEIHRLFLDRLESATVTTPSTANQAAAYLTQQAGFVPA